MGRGSSLFPSSGTSIVQIDGKVYLLEPLYVKYHLSRNRFEANQKFKLFIDLPSSHFPQNSPT